MHNELSGSRPKNIREQNIKSVLTLFYRSDTLAIRDVVKHTGLSVTTARAIINQLLERGILVSAGKGISTEEGGKRPECFHFNPNHQFILVCRFQDIAASLTLVNLRSDILREIPLFDDHVFDFTYERTMRHLAVRIEKALVEWQIPAQKIFRIVLSCNGICNQENSMLYRNPACIDREHFEAWPLPIAEDLKKLLVADIPIYLDNENMFIGYAELLDHDNDDIGCYVSLQEDGCCVIKEKEVQRGYLGFIGYHSHTILDHQSDLQCKCGAKGCFSALVREETLLQYVRWHMPNYPTSSLACRGTDKNLTASDIFAAADEGDALARKVMDIAIYWHYLKITNLIVVYNTQKIVIQGLYRNAGRYFYERFHELKENYPHLSDAKPTYIEYSKFESHTAEVKGAGLFVFQNFFVNEFTKN